VLVQNGGVIDSVLLPPVPSTAGPDVPGVYHLHAPDLQAR
jgi:hypothetical protein